MSNSNSQMSSSEQLDRVQNGPHASPNSSKGASSSKLIWELDGYKEVIKRSQSSNTQLSHLKKMLDERAQCERAYAESLFKWSNTWKKMTEAGSEEENFKEAWLAFTKEADAVREIHMQIASNLRAVRKNVGDWQTDNYKKAHTLRNIEKGFKNTQDQWSEKLKKVNERQSKYYSSCKDEHNIKQKNKTQSVTEQSDEQKRKALKKENDAHNAMLTAQDKYRKAVNELQGDKDRHRRDMENQFGHAQDFEKSRLAFTKQCMLTVCNHLNASAYPQHPAVYPSLHNLLNKASIEDDLSLFAQKRGLETSLNCPDYTEWTIEMAGPSLASAKGAASLKAVQAAVAFGDSKAIESGTGSYRLRADTSPPASATHGAAEASFESTRTQTATSNSSSNSASLRLQSQSTSAAVSSSSLPPPPESTSLHVEPKTAAPRQTTPAAASSSLSVNEGVVVESSNNNVVREKTKVDPKTGTLDTLNPFKYNTIPREPTEYDNPFEHSDGENLNPEDHVYSAPDKPEAGPSSSSRPPVPPPPPDDYDDSYSNGSEDEATRSGASDNYHVNMSLGSSGPEPLPRGTSVAIHHQNNQHYESEDEEGQSDVIHDDVDGPEITRQNGARTNCGSVVRDESKVEHDGVPVRALYSYEADEEDEISLDAGEEFVKLADADENGWAYGFSKNRYGLYPASYAEEI